MKRIIHLIDDPRLGGVGLHLRSFEHPELNRIARSTTLVVDTDERPPKLHAELVIIHFTMNWRKLRFLRRLRQANPGLPIVIEEHSYTEHFERLHVRQRWRFRMMLRLAYAMADAVVAVSETQADWLFRAGVVGRRKLASIPMSRPTELFETLEDPRREGPLRLGALGRFADQKGFEDAIEAVRELGPSVATLTLGGYGEREEALKKLASGVPNIHFSGRVDQPCVFLAGIDALIMPSRYEAFGLTGLEARAAGRPLIGYRVDGLVDQLSEGGCFAAEPGDIEGLKAAILALSRADLGKVSGEARLGVRWSYQEHVEDWAMFLRRVLG